MANDNLDLDSIAEEIISTIEQMSNMDMMEHRLLIKSAVTEILDNNIVLDEDE